MAYSKVQFIGYNINTFPKLTVTSSTATTLGATATYVGKPAIREDIADRVAMMAKAIKQAHDSTHTRANPDTLKVFMAPEFLFRGPEGAYTMDVASDLMAALRDLVDSADYTDWVLVMGTVIAASDPTEFKDGRDDPHRKIEAYNIAVIQRGGFSAAALAAATSACAAIQTRVTSENSGHHDIFTKKDAQDAVAAALSDMLETAVRVAGEPPGQVLPTSKAFKAPAASVAPAPIPVDPVEAMKEQVERIHKKHIENAIVLPILKTFQDEYVTTVFDEVRRLVAGKPSSEVDVILAAAVRVACVILDRSIDVACAIGAMQAAGYGSKQRKTAAATAMLLLIATTDALLQGSTADEAITRTGALTPTKIAAMTTSIIAKFVDGALFGAAAKGVAAEKREADIRRTDEERTESERAEVPGRIPLASTLTLPNKAMLDEFVAGLRAAKIPSSPFSRVVMKMHKSHIDFVRSTNSRVLSNGKTLTTTADTSGTATGTASDTGGLRLDDHVEHQDVMGTKADPISREFQRFSGDGGSIFDLAGIRFGVETCLDHAKYRLRRAPLAGGQKKIQLHLVPSAGMSIRDDATSAQKNGFIFNVDGNFGDAKVDVQLVTTECLSGTTKASLTPVTSRQKEAVAYSLSAELYDQPAGEAGNLYIYAVQTLPTPVYV